MFFFSLAFSFKTFLQVLSDTLSSEDEDEVEDKVEDKVEEKELVIKCNITHSMSG